MRDRYSAAAAAVAMARLQLLALLVAVLVAVASASCLSPRPPIARPCIARPPSPVPLRSSPDTDALTAAALTFCKCTCFKNSTIIPLGPAGQNHDAPASLRRSPPPPPLPLLASPPSPARSRRSVSTSCSECTRAFCLSQGIDFCKGAHEENVVTMCFQRDSNKDRIIVWGFLLGTVALLAWVALKHVMARRDMSYAPVAAAAAAGQ